MRRLHPIPILLATVLTCPALSAEVRLERRADGSLAIVGGETTEAAPATPAQRSRASEVQLAARRAEIANLIAVYSRRQSLDPRLVHAVVAVESGFDPRAVSRKGARGLMQLMPETARELGVEDAFDPSQNLRGGIEYLRRMVDRFGGDLRLALASYNAGPEAVTRHGGVPPFAETAGYVRKVLDLYRDEGGEEVTLEPSWQPVKLVSVPGQPPRITTEDLGPSSGAAR